MQGNLEDHTVHVFKIPWGYMHVQVGLQTVKSPQQNIMHQCLVGTTLPLNIYMFKLTFHFLERSYIVMLSPNGPQSTAQSLHHGLCMNLNLRNMTQDMKYCYRGKLSLSIQPSGMMSI